MSDLKTLAINGKKYIIVDDKAQSDIKTLADSMVTKNELAAKNYLTEDNLTGYAKTTDFVNYATTAALDNKADKTQLNDYVTTSALDGKGYLTSHQDISGKLDKTDISNAANKIPRYNAEGHLVLPDGTELW